MTDMNKINFEALENVAGGAERKEPGLNSKVFFTIPNGTVVTTTGRKVKKDGYVWYEIMLAGAYDTGWIAGSLIGF